MDGKERSMNFVVLRNSDIVPAFGKDVAYLLADNWNDWWEFQTLYVLTVFDAAGVKHEIGGVKIAQFVWRANQTRPDLPDTFGQLDDRFFSLGQDVSYYVEIAAMGSLGADILRSLHDLVADPQLFARASDEPVVVRSLMRSVSFQSVEGQFRRVLNGGAVLTDFSFSYEGPKPQGELANRLKLAFQVTPDSSPPTNIHVLIGRNGVGKSYLLNGMARALVSPGKNGDADGIFRSTHIYFGETTEIPFANVVSVTFSAFDEFAILPESLNASREIRYSNVGLRMVIQGKNDETVTITRDPADLAGEFSQSARVCVVGERGSRWLRALRTLETDPIFADAQVSSLVELDDASFIGQATQLFRSLSSGHKIVLLTITKLVEKVEEKTLVLMDEPEAHLHPPLLSALVRALSDLLTNRNGVAIIATHSPVLLQEVPASCVWKIVRHGVATRADRPEIETFGENVGVLTTEVFRLEVSRSGFHKLLADAVSGSDSYDSIMATFGNQLGSEGRALVSGLLAIRKTTGAD
jgi:predicted ATPase